MAAAVLDGSGARGFTAADGNNYGCAGRGIFDPFAITEGKQVDIADFTSGRNVSNALRVTMLPMCYLMTMIRPMTRVVSLNCQFFINFF